MKTKEQKFKQLLKIAVNNGYQINSHLREWLGIDDETAYGCQKLYIPDIVENKGAFMEFSLRVGYWYQPINDLVLNTNFFECLFKDFKVVILPKQLKGFPGYIPDDILNVDFEYRKDNFFFQLYEGLQLSTSKNTVAQFKKIQGVLEVEKGTALDWLFKQFNL